LAAFAVPVQSGWGLPESALRALLDPRQAARPVSSNTDTPQTAGQQRDLEAPPVEPSARRSAMTALLVAGVMLSGLFAFFLRSSSHADRPMHALSLILPVSTSLLVIGLGLFVATRRIRVSYDGELCIETRALGFVLRRLRVPKTALLGAWAVSPDSGPALHVLIATTSGPLAIRCSAQTARELAADLMRPLAECDA